MFNIVSYQIRCYFVLGGCKFLKRWVYNSQQVQCHLFRSSQDNCNIVQHKMYFDRCTEMNTLNYPLETMHTIYTSSSSSKTICYAPHYLRFYGNVGEFFMTLTLIMFVVICYCVYDFYYKDNCIECCSARGEYAPVRTTNNSVHVTTYGEQL